MQVERNELAVQQQSTKGQAEGRCSQRCSHLGPPHDQHIATGQQSGSGVPPAQKEGQSLGALGFNPKPTTKKTNQLLIREHIRCAKLPPLEREMRLLHPLAPPSAAGTWHCTHLPQPMVVVLISAPSPAVRGAELLYSRTELSPEG